MRIDYVRLSYGPNMDVLKAGLDGIARVAEKYGLHFSAQCSNYG